MNQKNNNSTIKSRLRVTQPAFVQLVKAGLKNLIGFSGEVNGYQIKLVSIDLEKSIFENHAVTQTFRLKLGVEKPQGWMPLSLITKVKLEINWSIVMHDRYPGIGISGLHLQSLEKTKVGILNINVGLPAFVEKKMFNEIISRKNTIEKLVNGQIKKIIKTRLSKSFVIPISKLSKTWHPRLKITKCLWLNKIDESIIFRTIIHLQLFWPPKEGPKARTQLNVLDANEETEQSRILVSLPLRELELYMPELTVPLGKLGVVKVLNIQMVPIDDLSAELNIQLTGDLTGSLHAKMHLLEARLPKVSIRELELKLESRLLDFGASLFESKIQARLEKELNEQLSQGLEIGVSQFNEILKKNERYFQLKNYPLKVKDLSLHVSFVSDSILAVVESELLSEVKVLEIPENLLQF